MYKFKKINHKLIFSFLALSLLPLIIFAFFSINMAKTSMQQHAFDQLESIKSVKKTQLTNYISALKASLLILDSDPYTAIALEKFSAATLSTGINGNEWTTSKKYQ